MLAFMWIACVGGGLEVPTAEAEEGPFEVVLAIPGELQAVRSVTISAPDLPGQTKVTWVVEEGTRVKEGDELVKFDETDLQEKLEKADNDLKVARMKIEQRQAQLDVRLGDMRNEVTNAELSLKRAQMRTTDSETVPRVEREAAQIDVQASTIALERSKSSLHAAKLEGEAEIELLRLETQRWERQLELATAALDEAVITAPSPGIVILPSIWKGGSQGPIAAGDTVWGGSGILELPDLSEMEVQAWVHEVDAAKVQVGQPVSIVIDAHPDPAHVGSVTKVADLAVRRDRRKSVKHLQVTLSLDETSPVMKPGMTVRAEVEVERLDDVVSVPQEAVFYDGEDPFVYVAGFAGFTPTSVALGTTNDTHVVVEDGLEAGAVVALVDPESADQPPRPGMPAAPSDPGEG